MAFDDKTRNHLQKLVSDSRGLLSDEFRIQVQQTCGLNPQHEPVESAHGMHLRAPALTGLTALYGALVEQGIIKAECAEVADTDGPQPGSFRAHDERRDAHHGDRT